MNTLKKLLLILMLIIISTFSISSYNIKAKSIEPTKVQNTSRLILLDPGHGGFDGGAKSKNGTEEKDINLNICKYLKDLLEKDKYKVLMTRVEDRALCDNENAKIRKMKREDLNNRCKMKSESKCDVFISVHLNMFPISKYYGPQVWYSNNENSKLLANILQDNLVNDLDGDLKRKEKVAIDEYKILRCERNIPSVIIECGFLSNPSDERKLNTEAYQQKIAQSIFKSIKQYYEKNSKL